MSLREHRAGTGLGAGDRSLTMSFDGASCNVPKAPGTYVLVLRNRRAESVQVGRLGCVATTPGYYLYVGSAFGGGGLRARIAHHLRVSATPHWHIDYLRRRMRPSALCYRTGGSSEEHLWAQRIGSAGEIEVAAARFGASDCACESHLFFSPAPPSLETLRCRRSGNRSRRAPDTGQARTGM